MHFQDSVARTYFIIIIIIIIIILHLFYWIKSGFATNVFWFAINVAWLKMKTSITPVPVT